MTATLSPMDAARCANAQALLDSLAPENHDMIVAASFGLRAGLYRAVMQVGNHTFVGEGANMEEAVGRLMLGVNLTLDL